MKTLIRKDNSSKIIVPTVVIGERYYIIEANLLGILYLIGDVYLDKEEWILENN